MPLPNVLRPVATAHLPLLLVTPTDHSPLPTTHCPLPSSYCQLTAAHWSLLLVTPTGHWPLATAHLLLPSSSGHCQISLPKVVPEVLKKHPSATPKNRYKLRDDILGLYHALRLDKIHVMDFNCTTPFLDASTHLYMRLRPSIRPFVPPSVPPSVRPSVHPSVRPSIHPSVHPLSRK